MESYINKGVKPKSTASFRSSDKPPVVITSSYDGLPLLPTSKSAQQQPVQTSIPVHRKAATCRTQPSGSTIGAQVSSNTGEQSPSVLNVLQKQQQITELLIQQQKASHLPPCEIPIFDGDPLQFNSFMKTFQFCVEDKTNNKGDCLYFLERYTKGRPKEIVRSCMNMRPERGYVSAKAMLKQHFGNDHVVSAAYMEKVLQWPMIKGEDVTALQDYAVFLRGCCNAMSEVQYLQELDMPANMRTVVSKLPFKLREKWRTVACDLLDQRNRRVAFDLVFFIEHQVKIISDPIFGYIQNVEKGMISKPKDVDKRNPQSLSKSKFKGNSFTTSVTDVDRHTAKEMKVKTEDSTHQVKSRLSNPVTCLFCSQNHSLEQCKPFEKIKHREKVNFLKGNAVCFGCLHTGHLSKECTRRLTCKTCHQKHPTVMHIHLKQKVDTAVNTDDSHRVEKTAPTVNNALVSAQACNHAGAGNSSGILPILPVQVKSSLGNKVIQTYAFLDTGSTSTFCSESLMRRLNLNGRKTKISLLTMSPKSTVTSYVVNNLEISSLTGKDFYRLPEVYTQSKMPVSSANTVKKEDFEEWPYLDTVHIPYIQADVKLLIGTNASKLLEPWEVVNSHGDGPYAIRTLLGWVINGSIGGCQSKGCTATVNRIDVKRLELLLEKQYLHDFNENMLKDKEEMSREDVKFMEIMKESVNLKEGHYSLKLPFKSKDVNMPNNLSIAKERFLGIRKKFEKSKKFQHEYTDFINNMVDQGYAEEVPKQEHERHDGKVWYIPHHGVYHPRKGKLQVVFDCGAEFKGTSLNGQLLQGPNLTSSLIGVLLRFRQEPVAFMTDVRAMFYQVRVTSEDKDFLRFLWWPNGDVTQDIIEYRMTVHLFGAVSSPSCACFALL
ncbi:hypothetical protein H4Q32_005610 [Labeo rohita]|uniref:CCHC-type domain-containing protein n=1 Tax=Labeo rohita TaxID=84645 RepID=A0ABQ8N3V4_LABRO|nr:hypothetical protein H4Q32_005610 [Labeo rohita]